jgi:murein DD-endopeptidase MepM/ murein hydrolase activator NlpD
MSGFWDFLESLGTGGSVSPGSNGAPEVAGPDVQEEAALRVIDQTSADLETLTLDGFPGAKDVTALYQEFLLGAEDTKNIQDNPLNNYINVTYGVSLSLVDAKAGDKTTYESLLKAKKVGFASSGGIEDDTEYFYGLTSLNAKNVLSITAANPELARIIEMNIEMHEPIGYSFDENIRKYGYELGLDPQPYRFIWRIDIWFSGFNMKNGSWTNKIPLPGFRSKTNNKITHFCHMISCDSTINAEGTTYNCTMVPVNMASSFREETILTPGLEIKVPLEEAKIETMFKTISYTLNKWSKEKGNSYEYEIKYPNSMKNLEIYDGKAGNTIYTYESKVVKMPIPNPSTALTLIMSVLKNCPAILTANSIPNSTFPNLSFAIIPEIDYSSATYVQASTEAKNQQGFNDYQKVKITFHVMPYFEWKSKLPDPGSISSRIKLMRKFLRREYDFAWTGKNVEVISFDTKLKTTYYINDGFDGISSDNHGHGPGTVNGNNTPRDNDARRDKQKKDWKDRSGEQWSSKPPAKSAAESQSPENPNATGTASSRVASSGSNVPSGSPVRSGFRSSRYGYRTDPFTGRKKFHSGTDIAVDIGTPVYATQDGVVDIAQTGYNGGYGNRVRIEGGRYDTGYNHLDSIAVRPGQRVRKGDLIGYSGSSGASTGPHLHYEVYDGEQGPDDDGARADQVDPERFGATDGLGGGPGGTGGEGPHSHGAGGDADIAYGRSMAVYPVTPVNPTNLLISAREKSDLAHERRIGPDLIKLDGFTVRGDPRWFLGIGQFPMIENQLSCIIRINVLVPDQNDYMNPEGMYRKIGETSLGGYYEVVTIDHEFRGGVYTQKMTGARVIGLNPT